MIDIQNIQIIKSGNVIVEDLQWQINKGEHWLIAGNSGSGKTILLEVIAGLLHPSQGSIEYDFINGNNWDEKYHQRKDKIHYIPAHTIQNLFLGQSMYYQQRYYTMGDEQTPLVQDVFGEHIHNLKVFTFPSSFRVASLLELPITRLSNGQLKKVLILKNLAKGLPKFLLLDFPFEGLDHRSRKDLIEFLDFIVEEYNVQIIIVDHHHDLPKAVNRKLVMHDCKIAAIENVSQKNLLNSYFHKREARVLSAVNKPIVQMQNVTIQYGAQRVIHNLNWTIYEGERWALVGKNGSGKTTLFSLIYADHPMAYSQQIYLFGKRRGSGESIWDIKNRINYLGPELINFLNPKSIRATARDYILEQHKYPIKTKLLELEIFFDVENVLSQPVKNLSSGQLQLMLLINYFLSDKELLLLDEPFQFLDLLQKQKVKQYLQQYLSKSITLVLITHYEEDLKEWTQLTLQL